MSKWKILHNISLTISTLGLIGMLLSVGTIIFYGTAIGETDASSWTSLGYVILWLFIAAASLPFAIFSTVYVHRHKYARKSKITQLVVLYATIALAALPVGAFLISYTQNAVL